MSTSCERTDDFGVARFNDALRTTLTRMTGARRVRGRRTHVSPPCSPRRLHSRLDPRYRLSICLADVKRRPMQVARLRSFLEDDVAGRVNKTLEEYATTCIDWGFESVADFARTVVCEGECRLEQMCHRGREQRRPCFAAPDTCLGFILIGCGLAESLSRSIRGCINLMRVATRPQRMRPSTSTCSTWGRSLGAGTSG